MSRRPGRGRCRPREGVFLRFRMKLVKQLRFELDEEQHFRGDPVRRAPGAPVPGVYPDLEMDEAVGERCRHAVDDAAVVLAVAAGDDRGALGQLVLATLALQAELVEGGTGIAAMRLDMDRSPRRWREGPLWDPRIRPAEAGHCLLLARRARAGMLLATAGRARCDRGSGSRNCRRRGGNGEDRQEPTLPLWQRQKVQARQRPASSGRFRGP